MCLSIYLYGCMYIGVHVRTVLDLQNRVICTLPTHARRVIGHACLPASMEDTCMECMGTPFQIPPFKT
jgi:hypothetical protein